MSSQVEFLQSRKFFELSDELKSVKITGIAKLRRVVHDGTCGYRCVSEQDGVPLEETVKKFINLSGHKDYTTAEVLATWCSNLQHHFETYCETHVSKRSLHSSAYLSSEALQIYANIYKCVFVMVVPSKSRGYVEVVQILAADEYTSKNKMYVILVNIAGKAFDYYEPTSRQEESTFDHAFRTAIEAIMKTEIYHYLRGASTEEYVPTSRTSEAEDGSVYEEMNESEDAGEDSEEDSDEDSEEDVEGDDENSGEDIVDDYLDNVEDNAEDNKDDEEEELDLDVQIPDVVDDAPELNAKALNKGPGSPTLIEIPLIQKDANIIEHREKIAKDFFDLFTAEKSNNFSIVIGGNKILMKKETSELNKRVDMYCSMYSEPDFVSADPYQYRLFSAIRRGDRLDVAPCWVWDEARKNCWLLLLIMKSRCAKQYFIMQDPVGELEKVCVDRDARFKKFIPDPTIPVSLELVASRLKTYFTTGDRLKWNQDPNKPRQKFAPFGDEPECNAEDQSSDSEDELEFDFTRLTFSAFDINLGFKPINKLEQVIGGYGSYSNVILHKRKVGFSFGDVVILKDHKVDSRRFYYAGAFKPNNKMDSDVHIAEFFVYDSAEMVENAELKKINLSHMQRSGGDRASESILNAIAKCVERYQHLAIAHGKLPRISRSITPTLLMLPPKVKKVPTPPVAPTPLKPVKLALEKAKQSSAKPKQTVREKPKPKSVPPPPVTTPTTRGRKKAMLPPVFPIPPASSDSFDAKKLSSNQEEKNSISSARIYLLARKQSYPEMKLKSWNWLYHSRYVVYCFEAGLKLEPFDVFMSIKNELGMRRNRNHKRDREADSENETSESDTSEINEDDESDTKSKLKSYSKTVEKAKKLKMRKKDQAKEESNLQNPPPAPQIYAYQAQSPHTFYDSSRQPSTMAPPGTVPQYHFQPPAPVYHQPPAPVYTQPPPSVYNQPPTPVYHQPPPSLYSQSSAPMYHQPATPGYNQPPAPTYHQPPPPVYHVSDAGYHHPPPVSHYGTPVYGTPAPRAMYYY